MIKKSWQQILVEADEFIKFLHKDAFFDTPYQENLENEFVTTDAVLARHFSEDDSFDDFDEWETVTGSEKVFPDSFDYYKMISYQLRKNNYFNLSSKEFNGALEKWTNSVSCQLEELMCRMSM